MKAQLYWIQGPWQGRLAVMARPRGGDWLGDEIRSWRKAGLDVVVSLLMPDEAAEFELQEEGPTCESHEVEFISFPIPDRGVPASRQEATQLLTRLSGYLASGRNVAIHCRQGIGRSGLLAAGVLILGAVDPREAVATISRQRGCEVPETPEQKKWLIDFASAESSSLRIGRAERTSM